MRISSKGQVTIPAKIRERARLAPGTEVTFEFDGEVVGIVRVKPRRSDGRSARAGVRSRGRGEAAKSADETMELTPRRSE